MAVTGIQLFANNSQSQLAGDITAAATTANLDSGGGALFPNPGANEYFMLTFYDADTGLINEIVKVTSMTGDTIASMVRGQEGTTARAWSAGDIAENLCTAGTMNNLVQPRDLQTQAGNYAQDTGTANAVVATLPVVPPTLTAIKGTAIRITKAAAANTGASTLALNGLAATPIVDLAGNALAAGALPSGCTFTVVYDGTHFVLQSSVGGSGPASGRIVLSSNQDFYVATTGNDSNDGLSPGTPWLTLQHAINVIYGDYDLANFNITVHVANGTYANGFTANGSPPPGANGPGSILFTGTTSAIISETGSCAVATNGAFFSISGLKLTSSGNNCITATWGGIIYFSGTEFGAATSGVHIETLNGGRIFCTGAYTISGGAENHLDAAHNSLIRIGGVGNVFAVTLTGTPAFSSNFAFCENTSTIFLDSGNISFSGTATGSKFNVKQVSMIDTNGGSTSYLPGSIAGTADGASGGYYA